jgi:hypothetical protein
VRNCHAGPGRYLGHILLLSGWYNCKLCRIEEPGISLSSFRLSRVLTVTVPRLLRCHEGIPDAQGSHPCNGAISESSGEKQRSVMSSMPIEHACIHSDRKSFMLDRQVDANFQGRPCVLFGHDVVMESLVSR